MNTTRIKQAIASIEENTLALEWLEQYGVNLQGRDKDAFSIGIRMHYAGSCPGTTEAVRILESFARLSILDLVATAITNCRNTIELERDAIRREASSDA